jgi:RNA polymerase sigma-70 factor, ECF subfamily
MLMSATEELFEQHREGLFRLAYGMLGKVAPAKDAVQEAYIRWQKQDTGEIQSPKAWLSKVVSRICLDEIKSARNKREQYIGPYLPEPVLISGSRSPDEEMELAESLSMALLVVLDELTPVERAVFLLREVFDYDYGSVAEAVQKSEANCRKIAQRAREKVEKTRPRFERNIRDNYRLADTFIKVVEGGDVTEIELMLAEDAILYSDGGGKVTAARKPVAGSGKIAKFLTGIQKGIPAAANWWLEPKTINGEPGMLVWLDGMVYNTWSFHVEEGKIKSIYVVLNPDKLRHLNEDG